MIIPNSNLKTKMYRNILDSIIKGEYKPETLLTEKMLVERFNVSKSPIREALIELGKEGVLRSIPRLGYEILRITNDDIANVQDYRLLIECGGMERYWDRINPKRLAHLDELLIQEGECDAIEHWNNNLSFHLEITIDYGNTFLYNSLSSALKILGRAYAQFYWEQWHRTTFVSKAEHHKLLLSHILEGDKQSAIQALEADILQFGKGNDFYNPQFTTLRQ